MDTPIELTIAAIDERIMQLQRLKSNLKEFFGGPVGPVVASPATPSRTPAQPAPAAAPRQRPRKHNYTLKPRADRDTKLTVSDAVRGIVAGWSGEFTNKALREQIISRHPELKNKCASLASHLAYMIEKGELVRLGKQGREVTLKRGPKFAGPRPNPSAAGKALLEQIHQEEASKLGGGDDE